MSKAPRTITAVTFDRGPDDPLAEYLSVDELIRAGTCTVKVTYSDGVQADLFRFYTDELTFSEAELVGLTEQQARKLFHDRDVAYLRS